MKKLSGLTLALTILFASSIPFAKADFEDSAYDRCIMEAEMTYDKELRDAKTDREKKDAKQRFFTRKLACMKLYL